MYEEIAKLGFAYGKARAAKEMAVLASEAAETEDEKLASALAVQANSESMEKLSTAFELLCEEE